jgi:hypothetical protein
MSNRLITTRAASLMFGVILCLPSRGHTQTAAHGHAGGGIGASECANGCPDATDKRPADSVERFLKFSAHRFQHVDARPAFIVS